MKTHILTVVLIIISQIALNSQSSVKEYNREKPSTECCGELQLYTPSKAFVTDSIICNRWDYSNNKFVPHNLTVNLYDGNGRMVESISGYYSTLGVYRHINKYEFTYNQFDSLSTRIDYFWNDTLSTTGAWDNSRLYQYTYDVYNRLVKVESSYSAFGTLSWENNTQEYWDYDSNGLLESITTEYWNTNENDWLSYIRYRFVYDSNYDLMVKYTDYSSNGDGVFLNSSRFLYNSTQIGNQLEIVQQTYNQTEWRNYKRELHTINNLGLSDLVLKESWNQTEMMWDTLFRERDYYVYSNHGDITDHIYQSSYIEWFNISREMYQYDVYGNITESSEYEWDHNMEYWDQTRSCIYQTTSNLLSVYSDEIIDFSVFPNPTSGYLNITMNHGMDYDEVKILLISASGQIIKKIEMFSKDMMQINLRDFDKGVYFVELEIDGISRVVKKVLYQ